MELHGEPERVIMAFENKKKSHHESGSIKSKLRKNEEDNVKEKVKRRKAAIQVLQ